jgi:hypothetical protein
MERDQRRLARKSSARSCTRGPADENRKSAQRSMNLHGRTHRDLECEKSAKADGTLNKTKTKKLKPANNTLSRGGARDESIGERSTAEGCRLEENYLSLGSFLPF